MPSEAFYRNTAKAAWVAPLVAVWVNYCNHANPSTAQQPRVQLVGGLIAAVLILTGFISGIVALRGFGTYHRASIFVPAVIGVTFNGLVILALVMVLHLAPRVSTASAAVHQRQQQIALTEDAEEGRRSVMEYGTWVGRLTTQSAMVGVASLDDQSPTARRLLDDLPVACSVLVMTARPAPGHDGVRLEPSSLSMEFADGRIVRAMDGDSILARAKDDPNGILRRFNAAYRADPTQDLYQAFSLIPAGTDLRNLRSVTFRMNGNPITIRGRFMSAEEKRTQYPRN